MCFLLFAADSLGRRKSLLVSSVGQAATLYVIGVYQKIYPGTVSSVSSQRLCRHWVYATDDDQTDSSFGLCIDHLRLPICRVSVHNAAPPKCRLFPPVLTYFVVGSFFQFGWGPCCWIYVSEIPTARLRTLNVAIAAATQWLINFVIARTTLSMLSSMGYVSALHRLPLPAPCPVSPFRLTSRTRAHGSSSARSAP